MQHNMTEPIKVRKVLVLNKWIPDDKNPGFAMVAFRDIELKRAKEKDCEFIEVRTNFETMTLPLEGIDKKVKSSRPVTDKATGTMQTLLYFIWKKDIVGDDPVKKKEAAKARKKATMMKAYELSNKLHEQDPEAWYKKYVLGIN